LVLPSLRPRERLTWSSQRSKSTSDHLRAITQKRQLHPHHRSGDLSRGIVAELHGVRLDEVRGQCRCCHGTARPRHFCWYSRRGHTFLAHLLLRDPVTSPQQVNTSFCHPCYSSPILAQARFTAPMVSTSPGSPTSRSFGTVTTFSPT
jgi:hypothetical protein